MENNLLQSSQLREAAERDNLNKINYQKLSKIIRNLNLINNFEHNQKRPCVAFWF